MHLPWTASPILTFAASLNSLSPLRPDREIDNELREAANGTRAEICLTAGCIRNWPETHAAQKLWRDQWDKPSGVDGLRTTAPVPESRFPDAASTRSRER